MKVTAESLDTPTAVEKSRLAVYSDLVKARLTVLVLLTTLTGFYLGQQGPANWVLLVQTVVGTGLLAAGAAALNQLMERRHDALMERTQDRPLPSERLHPDAALIFGAACSVTGMLQLAFAVNLLTSFLGALTLASYLFVYTPLKRITTLNTVIGAIPGALPPLMGWTAVRGEINGGGWALFAILFFWQLPHFLAIAWLYRHEYSKAGFVMLPGRDPDGLRTGRSAVSHTLGLLPVSLTPFLLGMAGPVYVLGAMLLGAVFVWQAIRFSRELTDRRARQLFFYSIVYLPLLLGLMALDKIR